MPASPSKKLRALNSRLAAYNEEMKTKVQGMTSRVTELEATNSALTRRMKELEEQLDDQARNHRADIAKKDHEIDYLNDQIKEYEEESRKLLEAVKQQKSRLGLSQ